MKSIENYLIALISLFEKQYLMIMSSFIKLAIF